MHCPSCKSDGAYVGLMMVECASESCAHFSIKAPGYKPKVFSIPEKLKLNPFNFISEDYKKALRKSSNSIKMIQSPSVDYFNFKLEVSGKEYTAYRQQNQVEMRKILEEIKMISEKIRVRGTSDFAYVYAPYIPLEIFDIT